MLKTKHTTSSGLKRAIVQLVVPNLSPPTASVVSPLNITVEEDGSQRIELEKMIDIGETDITEETLTDLQNCEIHIGIA